MPPSSSRRTGLRTRRDPDPQLQSDADTPDSIATPSRKRRRVATPQRDHEHEPRKGARLHSHLNGNATDAHHHQTESLQRTRITESVASNDSNVTLPNGTDTEAPMDPIERQNLIINHLRAPQHYTPHAAVDYANDLQLRKMEGDNIAAFAKVAGRDWCFFVQKTRFIIGRSDATVRPNPPMSSQPGASGGLPHSDANANDWGVDIDLGPERQISRVHAEINYDATSEMWYITVNSRNGLKLDDQTLQKGHRAVLHSGICIGIMGTQMIFLLANQEDSFHPMLWRQIKIDREINDSDDDANPPNRDPTHAHPNGPTPKREYDPFPPTSARQRAAAQLLTSTPGRPNPNTPMAFRSSEKHLRSQDSPAAYPRGMMMDSTEDIDYSADSAKDIKPPHSYAQLIGQAILSSPDEMLTLANIYDHIKSRYAFFRHTSAGWQNSIRHNLSLNKSFEKIARRTDEPGKGMKWKIADSEREDFVKKQMLNPRKGGGAAFPSGTPGPSSPALGIPSSQRDHREPLHASERLQGALSQDVFRKQGGSGHIKSPPRSATPPLSSIQTANQSFTPERGPRSNFPPGNAKQSPNPRDQDRFVTPAKRLLFPDTDDSRQPAFAKVAGAHRGLESSPMAEPVKQNVSGLRGEAANSPPTLYSDPPTNNAGGNQEAHRNHNALVTPLVSRHAPRLAPPSTAQVPSQYMNFSSPAPFWKFIDLPSTPARAPADLSPIKLRQTAERDAQDEAPQPSSPPVIREDEASIEPEDDKDDDENKGDDDEDAGPESPSRTVSRPVSRQVGATTSSSSSQQQQQQQHRSRSNSNLNGGGGTGSSFEPKPSNGNAAAAGGMVRGASLGSFEEEPEEEGFDLSKGFQKIGSFHRNLAQAHGVVGGRGS